GGMAAGAVTSLSYIRLMVTIYLSFTLIPLSIRFFISGTELSIAMGSMVVLAFLVVLQLATQSYKKNIENIRMRIDNIKQAQSLKHSEHRYKTILETATDSFFLHDLTGKLIDVNNQACRSLGYTKNELIEMSVTDIELTADKDIPLDVWDTLKEGENIVLDGVHRRKDGSTFPVEVSLGLILMGNESFISVLARDVTERKRIEKMKEQFISTVSHELRTPLTSIRGSLSLLTGGAAGDIPKQAQEMLAIASNNTERLLRLINDLLDIQKIESDELEMEFEDIPIAPILKQAIEDNNAYAEQYGVTINLNPISKDVMVYANKDYLMQVMANLLSNAAKFSHENGVVDISVSQEHNNKIRISISDQGQGIPEDFYSKIFGKFSQSDSSDTRQKGGTGLGLNITKAIVEKHGGEIGFTSQVDKGTTFYFELPISNVTTN
ncbi:MAG: cell wall metabolism sensor histidine kinase WalK, partial [Gammaproteobacteria bacterium]|nr:cell wall metabolism sensor histidine kinase WalK [Gammaproteobacteria bacterium]